MIEPVKKAQIVVLKEDYEKVIKSLQHYEVIMIINHEEGVSSPSLEINEGLKSRVEKVISFSKKFEEKKSLFGDYKEIDYHEFSKIDASVIDKIGRIESLQEKVNALEQENKDLQNEILEYEAFRDLDIRLDEVKETKYTLMSVGYLPIKYLDSFKLYMEEGNYLYQTYGQNKNGIATIISYFNQDKEEVNEKIKLFGFNDFNLPKKAIFMSNYLDSLQKEVDNNNSNLKSLNDELLVLSRDIDSYRLLSDQILTQDQINNIYYQTTLETSIIEGWVREDRIADCNKAIEEATKYYDVEYLEPEENDKVPTYTKNKKFASQFETITDMFSKPNSKEVDPNPVMSVWYWLLFGMMMGDVGYGLMMLGACLLLKKLMRPKGNTLKLINVIMYSSVPTILWGIVFGSYFGFNPQTDFGITWWWYWFSPMSDPIMMLIVSVAVGALHLITGLIVKMVVNIKEKNIYEMLAVNLSWILIMAGIGAYFIYDMLGLIMIICGVALILLFNGARKKSIFSKATSGLLGLYNVTSYMGDLLSYSRIMALAMSSAAVAMVMNTLAQMVGGSVVGMFFAAIIFIAGHSFNLVLGLLSAYVHDSRLQYIEFFGKFYEGGGIDFKPLSVKTKYINDVQN